MGLSFKLIVGSERYYRDKALVTSGMCLDGGFPRDVLGP